MPWGASSLTDSDIEAASKLHTLVPVGHKIGKPEVLFQKIDDASIESLRARFGGGQDQPKDGKEPMDAGKKGAATSPLQSKPDKSAKANKMKEGTAGGAKKAMGPNPGAPVDVSKVDLRVSVGAGW